MHSGFVFTLTIYQRKKQNYSNEANFETGVFFMSVAVFCYQVLRMHNFLRKNSAWKNFIWFCTIQFDLFTKQAERTFHFAL